MTMRGGNFPARNDGAIHPTRLAKSSRIWPMLQKILTGTSVVVSDVKPCNPPFGLDHTISSGSETPSTENRNGVKIEVEFTGEFKPEAASHAKE
jgi:hypothetical protein